jgi:hypothetical protein
MMPLMDSYIKELIQKKIEFIKAHPELVEVIFGTLVSRETLEKFTKFVTTKTVKVMLGFPREQQSLPCIPINLAGEQEVPLGLGDNVDAWEYDDIPEEEEDDEHEVLAPGARELEVSPEVLKFADSIKEPSAGVERSIGYQYSVAGTYMKATFRLECWSDNGDLTTYIYTLLKWCILSARRDMLENAIVNIEVGATDLEPVPDYFPTFVYRRALLLTFQYENKFFDGEQLIDDTLEPIVYKANIYNKDISV